MVVDDKRLRRCVLLCRLWVSLSCFMKEAFQSEMEVMK